MNKIQKSPIRLMRGFLMGSAALTALVACSSADEVSALGDAILLDGVTIASFDRANPAEIKTRTRLLGLAADETMVAIDIRPSNGALYGLSTDFSNTGRLYYIDPETGVVSLLVTLTAAAGDTYTVVTPGSVDIDFDPVRDRLRLVSSASGQNLLINPDTGAVNTQPRVSNATASYYGAAYSNDYAGGCSSQLYGINVSGASFSGDRLIRQGQTDSISLNIGHLGFDASVIAGFDIATALNGSNSAYAVLTTSGTQHLYSINLATGAGTLVGDFDSADIRSLALRVDSGSRARDIGDMLAVTVGNRLIGFGREAPGTLCNNVAVTGLAAGDQIVGMDIRQADGLLWAVTTPTTSTGIGRLYTIDRVTGVATYQHDLSQAVTAGDYGVSFDQVTGVLRLVSTVTTAGLNWRVDVTTGTVTVDAALKQGTNAFPASDVAFGTAVGTTPSAALTVTAYFIYANVSGTTVSAGRLFSSTAPAGGALNPVGSTLGVSIDRINGFDIETLGTLTAASAYLAGSSGTTEQSRLYRVNLAANGAAFPIGVAVPVVTSNVIGGGERVRDIVALP